MLSSLIVREDFPFQVSPNDESGRFESQVKSGKSGFDLSFECHELDGGTPGWFRKFQLYGASVELVRVAFHRLFVGG